MHKSNRINFWGYYDNNSFHIKEFDENFEEDVQMLKNSFSYKVKIYKDILASDVEEALILLRQQHFKNEFN